MWSISNASGNLSRASYPFVAVAVLVFAALAISNAAGAPITYNFEGSDEGWVDTKSSPTDPPIGMEASNRTDAAAAPIFGTWRVIPEIVGAFSPTEDSTHDTLVFSSPTFTLFPQGSISLYLWGGPGNLATPLVANFASLPVSSSATTGYLGVGLRRVSDGAYLLNVRNNGGWTLQNFTNASLTANGAIGVPLALDFIDYFHGGGGWAAMDMVTITLPEPSFAAIGFAGAIGLLSRSRRRS